MNVEITLNFKLLKTIHWLITRLTTTLKSLTFTICSVSDTHTKCEGRCHTQKMGNDQWIPNLTLEYEPTKNKDLGDSWFNTTKAYVSTYQCKTHSCDCGFCITLNPIWYSTKLKLKANYINSIPIQGFSNG